jgi:hypothetical protein
LKERGLGIETYDSVKYLYPKIEYPLSELTKFLNSQTADIATPREAQVSVEALRTQFKELMQIASEIDEEYSSGKQQ